MSMLVKSDCKTTTFALGRTHFRLESRSRLHLFQGFLAASEFLDRQRSTIAA